MPVHVEKILGTDDFNKLLQVASGRSTTLDLSVDFGRGTASALRLFKPVFIWVCCVVILGESAGKFGDIIAEHKPDC